jgi:hypothetical protein
MARTIFISHKEADRDIAAALVEYLLSALEISDDEIRCTSVPGHQLPFGVSIAQQIQTDLSSSVAILAILTGESLRATWVLFELGSAWALQRMIVLILGPRLTHSDLPGPLNAFQGVSIDEPSAPHRLRDATRQIARVLGIAERTGGKVQARLEEFIQQMRQWRPQYLNKGPLQPGRPLAGLRLDLDAYKESDYAGWSALEVRCLLHSLETLDLLTCDQPSTTFLCTRER